MDTVSALKTSTLFREKMGSEFIDYIVAIKEFEVAGRARDRACRRCG
jgi:hypothetical protein